MPLSLKRLWYYRYHVSVHVQQVNRCRKTYHLLHIYTKLYVLQTRTQQRQWVSIVPRNRFSEHCWLIVDCPIIQTWKLDSQSLVCQFGGVVLISYHFPINSLIWVFGNYQFPGTPLPRIYSKLALTPSGMPSFRPQIVAWQVPDTFS